MKFGTGSHQAAVTVKIADGVDAVEPADWDRCAGGGDPFLRHAFFAALERSGSASRRTGWVPAHLTAHCAGRMVGLAPCHVKTHSYGEYVFDQGWAAAWERAGGRYYPKLQCAVPFTPAPGPRLLLAPDAPPETGAALIAAFEELATANGFSSAHATFVNERDAAAFARAGWMERCGVQYHWFNQGYGRFDDFLATLSSRKRKQIRKERQAAAESGVVVHLLTGDALKPAHWDAFHQLYLQTADRKWGGGYLNRDFFRRLGDAMADDVLLAMCEDRGRWVAGALNLIGADALYGRNWGADGTYPFLHFEACYYRAIEFAVARGLSRVEAGAQGEHKIQRGYLPVRTQSFHWIADTSFRAAVDAFLRNEKLRISEAMEELRKSAPYRKHE